MATELAVFVCSHVFEATRPVLLAARADGDLMFMCGAVHQSGDEYRVVGLGHLLERDPTLASVANLDNNWQAERSAVGSSWSQQPLDASEFGEDTA